MHIAMFSESYLPYISGVTVSIQTLTEALSEQGHNVELFVPAYPDGKVAPDNTSMKPSNLSVISQLRNVTVHRFPSLPAGRYPGYRLAIPFSKMIYKTIEASSYDLLHTHSPFQLGQLAKRIARKKKLPLVFTFHTVLSEYVHYIPLLHKKFSWPFLRSYLRAFCKSCDAIVVPSLAIQQTIVKEDIQTPVWVIPTAPSLSKIATASGEPVRKKYGLENHPVLLYAGRLSQEKNLTFLFQTVSIVLKKFPQAKFLVVGSGPYEQPLKKLANEQGISSQVIFTGKIPRDEIASYYKAGDIFVFASKSETQGLVLAEAKSCGLPIVALHAPGVTENIDHGVDGFLIQDEDPLPFSEKIQLLLEDPALRLTFSTHALHTTTQRFSPAIMAANTLSLYQSLMESAKTS